MSSDEIADSVSQNAVDKNPVLEDIIGDFIDDVARKVYMMEIGGGGEVEANGLVALFHNTYRRIDKDRRCKDFAVEMSKWAMDYTKSVSGGKAAKPTEKKNAVPYFQLGGGVIVLGIATYEVMLGYSVMAMMGYFFSGILLLKGLNGLRKMRESQGHQGFAQTKPYGEYVDDIKKFDVEDMREALLAKKEYAYANLKLVPKLST